MSDSFGISGTVYRWLQDYLRGRSFQVRTGSSASKKYPLECGVPQGSVLGPTTFSLYVGSVRVIFDHFELIFHIYADDIQVYCIYDPSVPGALEQAMLRIRECVTALCMHLTCRGLKLNPSKTEFIAFMSAHHLRTHYNRPDLELDGITIYPVDNVRDLGAFLDTKMNMQAHVNYVCRTCHFHLRQIGLVRRFLTEDACRSAVLSLVISRLDYCNSLLINICAGQTSRLQRIQNKAARLVTLTPVRQHITPILHDLHWLPVAARIEYKVMLCVYKCQQGLAPIYLSELLHPKTRHASLRPLHDELQLATSVPDLNIGRTAFQYAAPLLWNVLPVEIRRNESVNCFKKQLKTFLFRRHFNHDLN